MEHGGHSRKGAPLREFAFKFAAGFFRRAPFEIAAALHFESAAALR
jgi:hypothetical protein